MIFGPIRAVAIDDEPGHLLGITTGLTAIGIPCMGYWYDRDLNALKPAPAEGGLPFVRIVFMDLNLAEQAGMPDVATLTSGVIDVLSQIISKDGGPYLLVFWTQVSSRVEEVSRMVFERLEAVAGVPCPIAITSVAKGPFIVGDPVGENFKAALRDFYVKLHENIAALRDTVRQAAQHNVQLSAASLWEYRASEAAALAVNEVFGCAKNQAPDPAERAKMTERVLAKLAVAAAGRKPAVTSPARALDAGMLDILIDQFGASVGAPEYVKTIAAAIGEAVKTDYEFPDRMGLYADLNTFCHIDTEIADANTTDRGIVLSAGPPLNRGTLGFNSNELITAEFLFPHELFPEDRRDSIFELLKEFRKAAEVVLVEIGADCDHAQATDRTRRYLIGLEVPQKFMELTTFHEDGKLRNEALQILGPWRVNDEIRYLLVSCRRFWIWQQKAPPQGTIRYRLRSSVVNKLLHHYCEWSSRPGIIEFRS